MVASPDRRYTVYARDDERDITIVDADTGETEAMLSSDQTRDILWSNDSQMLFVINDYGSVTVWHNDQIQTINAEYGDMSAAVDVLNKNIFTASFYHRVHVWDAQTGEQLPDLNWYATAVASVPTGHASPPLAHPSSPSGIRPNSHPDVLTFESSYLTRSNFCSKIMSEVGFVVGVRHVVPWREFFTLHFKMFVPLPTLLPIAPIL